MSGERAGAWTLERRLARGGMGEAWLATDGSGRRGFLKRVRAGLSGAPVLERFEIERRVLERLRVDGVPRLLDAGSQHGAPYFVLEFIEGRGAREAAETLALDSRRELAERCIALAGVVHAQGFVHGDLKPANYLVASSGALHVVDFGLARFAGEPPRLGADARLMTPRYAAPEQFRGEPVTFATDVYALGWLAHELVSLESARSAAESFAELERAALDGRAPSPTACRAGFDRALARACTLESAGRFADAREFAAALRARP